MKNFDEEKGAEQITSYMMIALSMAMFIGFALGWVAHMLSGAFA